MNFAGYQIRHRASNFCSRVSIGLYADTSTFAANQSRSVIPRAPGCGNAVPPPSALCPSAYFALGERASDDVSGAGVEVCSGSIACFVEVLVFQAVNVLRATARTREQPAHTSSSVSTPDPRASANRAMSCQSRSGTNSTSCIQAYVRSAGSLALPRYAHSSRVLSSARS